MKRIFSGVLPLLFCALQATAQDVPDFAAVAGHGFGERITVHAEMVRYLETLAEASPRVRVIDQGTSWEGRRLLLAIVTSPENHARLDEIRQTAVRLGDPRRIEPGELDAIVASQPAVVWLGGSIHGFELSGSEGLLKLLEHLTTRDDETTLRALDEAVVLIDPMLNPDGRDGFAHFNHQRLGHEPNPRREDWTNATNRWEALQFRTGHYFFDNNRDWFAHTQLETRHRVPTFLAWRPQVAIDAHEMGPDNEFYFDPAMEPYGIYFPAFARQWFERFNAAYAAAFDAAGFEYTTRELFNFYYPGYTTSYNSYQGAVGMLYEQGSSRGLALERGDGSVRRLTDALEHHYTAAWAAVKTAVDQRETLLREFHDSIRQAMNEAGKKRYLITAEGDPLHVRELVDLLGRNGIEVSALRRETSLAGVRDVGERSFAAGTYVVEASQPRAALVRTLLESDLPMPEGFLAEARKRLDRDQDPRFYDMTSWSLPLLFNVGVYSSDDARALETEDVVAAAVTEPEEASYAYLIDGHAAASVAVAHHLRRRGYRAAVTLEAGRFGGEDVPRGSGLVTDFSPLGSPRGDTIGGQQEGVHAAVRELARRFGVRVRAVSSGLGEDGSKLPALGSRERIALRPTEVAIVAEGPIHANSFGFAWYVLDRQYGIPVTVLRFPNLGRAPLHDYQTLVIPDLASVPDTAADLGEDGIGRLKTWISEGGTLVAIAGAMDFVVEHLELGSLRDWYEVTKEEESGEEQRRFEVPGALLRAELDPKTWLTAGYRGDEVPFLLSSDRLYLPGAGPPDSSRRVAARIASEDVRLSGHVWSESLERLPGTVLVYEEKVGRGRVILFSEDVNYRAYWRGSDRLFLNAVLLGPSAP